MRIALIAAIGLVACGRPEPAPHAEYALAVRVLPEARRIEVEGSVRLPPSDRARAELRYALAGRMGEILVEVVEPAESAGPAGLERVTAPDRERVEGERNDATWALRPRRPIPAGESVLVKFSYEGSGEPGFIYYVGPEVAFASGWGEAWYPAFKDIPGQATSRLTVSVPEGWTTVTGEARASDFTFVAGPYTRVRHAGTVPISAYLLSPREHIETYLAGVESMAHVLSAEFGPFPFEELVLVDVPRELAIKAGFNAFSPAGMVVLNSRAFDVPGVKYLLEWLGHEMSHQWFPHAVTWDPAGFPYLEEALAEYGGLRVVEEIAGPETATRTRTSGFEHDPIYSAAAYFKLVAAGADEPLASMGTGINERNLAYNKGSLVFDMLSREVGRDAFRHALRDITRKGPFHTITWAEFVQTVEVASGKELDGFFEQWLERPGAPDFAVSWTQIDDAVRLTVTQPTPAYRVRLSVEIRGDDDQRLARVMDVRDTKAELMVTAGFRVTSVVLDPAYEVLRWTPEYRALAKP